MGNALLKKKNSNRGQSILETSVIFVLIFLFLGAIVNIWFWSNDQIIHRQLGYNAGRIKAGTAIDAYELEWPVYKDNQVQYAPLELNDENTFVDIAAPETPAAPEQGEAAAPD